jgi:anti-sigma regulatory factor (Ser/Thr protein kinase)
MTAASPKSERGGDPPVLRLDLEPNPEAPSLARAAITGFCENLTSAQPVLSTLVLLVSEVVTNAVIHPNLKEPAEIRFCARVADHGIRIEVTDRGSGFTPRARDPTQVGGGYGLYLLSKVASRWGVERRNGTMVWFEVATSRVHAASG